jgi:hypothetical protein
MLLVIDHADRDHCERCSSRLDKSGFFVADQAGVRKFLCMNHVAELLHGCLIPVRTIRSES